LLEAPPLALPVWPPLEVLPPPLVLPPLLEVLPPLLDDPPLSPLPPLPLLTEPVCLGAQAAFATDKHPRRARAVKLRDIDFLLKTTY
jgi:hypothetical protein